MKCLFAFASMVFAAASLSAAVVTGGNTTTTTPVAPKPPVVTPTTGGCVKQEVKPVCKPEPIKSNSKPASTKPVEKSTCVKK